MFDINLPLEKLFLTQRDEENNTKHMYDIID